MTDKKPLVLIVEDEVHLQRIIKYILEDKGIEVVVKSNGEDALEWMNAGHRPSVILLDIMMPGMDGLTVLRQIKTQSDLKSTPVVLLTALAQENVVVQGIKLGAKDYIRKPFLPNDLAGRVLKLCA